MSIPFRFVPQESLPTDSALAEWYAVASEREQVTNAVLTAKDSSSVWHTWICAGDGALTVERITEGEGTDPLVVIHLVSAKERSVQKGLYYVSIFSEGRPSFEVRVDGEDTGVIVTYSETPVAP